MAQPDRLVLVGAGVAGDRPLDREIELLPLSGSKVIREMLPHYCLAIGVTEHAKETFIGESRDTIPEYDHGHRNAFEGGAADRTVQEGL